MPKLKKKIFVGTFGAFKENQGFYTKKMFKEMNHTLQSYIYGYKWVLEGLFLIETLKMGIIYTLHFPPKKAKEENTHFLRGHNSWSYQLFDAQFFGNSPGPSLSENHSR